MAMVYKWGDGSRLKANPGKVGKELRSLGKNFTPEEVVKFAKNSKTELHKCFEWDDSKAGKQYRLDQARYVIRHLVEMREDDGGEKFSVRAYESIVTSSKAHRRAYVPISEALNRDEYRVQVMQRLMNEVSQAVHTAKQYQQFVPSSINVVSSLETAQKRLQKIAK